MTNFNDRLHGQAVINGLPANLAGRASFTKQALADADNPARRKIAEREARGTVRELEKYMSDQAATAAISVALRRSQSPREFYEG